MNGNKEWRNTALYLSIFIAYNFLPPTKNKCWFSMIVNLITAEHFYTAGQDT